MTPKNPTNLTHEIVLCLGVNTQNRDGLHGELRDAGVLSPSTPRRNHEPALLAVSLSTTALPSGAASLAAKFMRLRLLILKEVSGYEYACENAY